MSSKKPSASYKPGQSGKKAAAAPQRTSLAGSSATSTSGSARKLSLAQQIAELSSATPKNLDFDPEDVENGGLASARVTDDFDAESEDDSRLMSERSTIRKNFDVDDVSEEYKGRVVSRKSLQAFSDESEVEDDDEEDAELDGEDEEIEDADDEEMADGEDDEESAEDGEEAESGEDDDDDEDEDGSDLEGNGGTASMLAAGLSDKQRKMQQQLAALEEEDDTSLFQPRGADAGTSVTSSSAASQYTKSLHMKNQQTVHTHLLNMRIRVQGVLANANRLPSSSDDSVDVREEFVSQSNEVGPSYSAAFGDARKVLDELFELQSSLMHQNEKIFAPTEDSTSSIPKFAGTKRKHDDDEDAETEAAEEDSEEVLDAYWQHLSGSLTPFFRPIQDALIHKWNTKTQLSAGQLSAIAGGAATGRGSLALPDASFKVINQSVVAQIDSIMLDESRLIRRAQLHRATGEHSNLLGRVSRDRERASKKPRGEDDDPALLAGRLAEEYDSAIYDDNDFYQQVLSEIIAQASAESSGDTDLVNKASAARKKTRKSGAQVDRRASKGRKLRYTVHAKLANFMAPKPAPITTDYANSGASDANHLTGSGFAMDELFMNLFGGGLKA